MLPLLTPSLTSALLCYTLDGGHSIIVVLENKLKPNQPVESRHRGKRKENGRFGVYANRIPCLSVIPQLLIQRTFALTVLSGASPRLALFLTFPNESFEENDLSDPSQIKVNHDTPQGFDGEVGVPPGHVLRLDAHQLTYLPRVLPKKAGGGKVVYYNFTTISSDGFWLWQVSH